MISAAVTVVNKLGLHARAATKLVNCASKFDAEVTLKRGAREINAKSIMGVLTLAASIGTELVVTCDGPDKEDALGSIMELINDRFGEGE